MRAPHTRGTPVSSQGPGASAHLPRLLELGHLGGIAEELPQHLEALGAREPHAPVRILVPQHLCAGVPHAVSAQRITPWHACRALVASAVSSAALRAILVSLWEMRQSCVLHVMPRGSAAAVEPSALPSRGSPVFQVSCSGPR